MVGEITQIPPMYCAIKVKGERLYKAARRGETVERKERRCVDTQLRSHARPARRAVGALSRGLQQGHPRAHLARDLGRRLGIVAHLTAFAGRASASTTFETRGPSTRCSRRAGPCSRNTSRSSGGERSRKRRRRRRAEKARRTTGARRSRTLPPVRSGFDTTIRTVREGASDAATVAAEDVVTVHATGTVEQTMKTFWSTKRRRAAAVHVRRRRRRRHRGVGPGRVSECAGRRERLRIPATGVRRGWVPRMGDSPRADAPFRDRGVVRGGPGERRDDGATREKQIPVGHSRVARVRTRAHGQTYERVVARHHETPLCVSVWNARVCSLVVKPAPARHTRGRDELARDFRSAPPEEVRSRGAHVVTRAR